MISYLTVINIDVELGQLENGSWFKTMALWISRCEKGKKIEEAYEPGLSIIAKILSLVFKQ